MIKLVISVLLFGILYADITFPKLTGRIVDAENIFSSQQEKTLSNILQTHENNTSNQIVIVTLKDFTGITIEEYAYQLGRHWAIGQKDINNGVILIISKNKQKVRIEVGYGLEGSLTDAKSSNIIQTMTPYFKNNDFYNGTRQGVKKIISTINNEYQPEHRIQNTTSNHLLMLLLCTMIVVRAKISNKIITSILSGSIYGVISWFVFFSIIITILAFLGFSIFSFFTPKRKPSDFYSSSNFSSTRSSFRGFSGGGGSFGGGGASGSW